MVRQNTLRSAADPIRQDREHRILSYLADRLLLGEPPTFEEIAVAERLGVSTVIGVLRLLKRQGRVTWNPLERRSIRLL